jgi:hypothetical protein
MVRHNVSAIIGCHPVFRMFRINVSAVSLKPENRSYILIILKTFLWDKEFQKQIKTI